jgi:hypothetical protein
LAEFPDDWIVEVVIVARNIYEFEFSYEINIEDIIETKEGENYVEIHI